MERPILFSGPMIRAVLGGEKTETRRVVRTSRTIRGEAYTFAQDRALEPCVVHGTPWLTEDPAGRGARLITSPYGYPGDHLWVRETHAIRRLDYWPDYWRDAPEGGDDEQPSCMEAEEVYYQATPRVGLRRWVGPTAPAPDAFQGRPHRMTYLHESSPLESGPAARVKGWRPSIHMPRWASRLTLRVEEVRVERLQKIDDLGAIAEGCGGVLASKDGTLPGWADSPRDQFRRLWDSINSNRAPWGSNPWVWVVSFSRMNAPGAA